MSPGRLRDRRAAERVVRRTSDRADRGATRSLTGALAGGAGRDRPADLGDNLSVPSRRPTLHPLPLLALLAACSGGSGGTGAASAGSSSAASADESSAGTASSEGATGSPTTTGTNTNTSTNTGTSTSPTGATGATGATGDSDPTTTSTTTTGAETGGEFPPLGDDACDGYATRYWDCCKAHCGWPGNVNPATEPLQSCDKGDGSHGAEYTVASSCQALADDSAFTCYDNAPWAVDGALAYGFAAVPANGDICGRCYQLEFDGTGHYNAQDPGSVALKGKTMVVQATNIGFDVGGGQFDILTPGGGVGLFDACSFQWDVATPELGATYGGFMTYCQQQNVGADHQKLKECVLSRCAAVFDEPALAELAAGCAWYVQWYEVADNPNLRYQEVACPPEIVARSGIDRGPLNDVDACKGGGAACTQQEMDRCDCAWTNNGANCGRDDGSCCWTACCG
jgi:hypothetical protein